MSRHEENFYSILGRAHVRDRDGIVHEGEAVLLACLMHTKGDESKDLEDVWRIMKNHNAGY